VNVGKLYLSYFTKIWLYNQDLKTKKQYWNRFHSWKKLKKNIYSSLLSFVITGNYSKRISAIGDYWW